MNLLQSGMRPLLVSVLVVASAGLTAASEDYAQKKAEKLAAPSPFAGLVTGKEEQKIVYQDEHVVAFAPLRAQAPVHFLIVPRRRISTLNEVTDADALLLGRLILAAKKLAKAHGIDESGYRIAINTNEDAGQSVFHVHVHLLGGMNLGPMLPQTYQAKP